MLYRQVLFAFVLAGIGLPLPANAGEEPQRIEYGCNDLVVVGRFDNLDYEHVDLENDVLGHGWMTANFKVKRVLFGRPSEMLLPVKYFGHTYYREDKDFVVVLERKQDDFFFAPQKKTWPEGRRPKMAVKCK